MTSPEAPRYCLYCGTKVEFQIRGIIPAERIWCSKHGVLHGEAEITCDPVAGR